MDLFISIRKVYNGTLWEEWWMGCDTWPTSRVLGTSRHYFNDIFIIQLCGNGNAPDIIWKWSWASFQIILIILLWSLWWDNVEICIYCRPVLRVHGAPGDCFEYYIYHSIVQQWTLFWYTLKVILNTSLKLPLFV